VIDTDMLGLKYLVSLVREVLQHPGTNGREAQATEVLRFDGAKSETKVAEGTFAILGSAVGPEEKGHKPLAPNSVSMLPRFDEDAS
jgi:hypothetical protein